MTLALDGTRIGRLRVRANSADPQAHAERCALDVRSLDLQPPGLPPQAILCVRALHDPLPGGVQPRARAAHLRPLAWQSAARAALADALSRAARPVRGSVAGDVDAVLFADTAEMLACAARDACRGALAGTWWWQHLLPDRSFAGVVRQWERAPRYVPAAFDTLFRVRSAIEFLQTLPERDAARVLDATLRAHALPSLADDMASVLSEKAQAHSTAPTRSPVVVTQMAERPAAKAPSAPVVAPWTRLVPADLGAAPIGVVQATLAAIAIVLRVAPPLARRPSFAAETVAYLQSLTAEPVVQRNGKQREPSARPAREAAVATPQPLSARERSVSPTRLTDSAHGARPASLEPPATVRTQRDSPALVHRNTKSGQQTSPTEPTHARRESPVGRKESISSPRDAVTATLPAPPSPLDVVQPATGLDTGVQSSFAGAFFLLNVAVDLGLYSDGHVVRDEIDLGIWDFVKVVAASCARDRRRDDPLWQLLADVRGAMPAATLAAAERRRLLARVRRHCSARLAVPRALACLVKNRGRVTRSAGHLDVHFALDRHPLAIRIARLDRNPGWIPAAGVHVAFHFD